jgi:hypothetical protein
MWWQWIVCARGQFTGGLGDDRVAMGPELMVDEIFESVPSLRGGRQPEPVLRGYSVQHIGESRGGNMVAFVDNSEPVPGGDLIDVRPPCQRGQQRNVNDTSRSRPSATHLSALDTEMGFDAMAPLIGQGFAVDEDERGRRACRDRSARHDGLAGARRRDQDAGFLATNFPHGVSLLGALNVNSCGFPPTRLSSMCSVLPADSTNVVSSARRPRGRTRSPSSVSS